MAYRKYSSEYRKAYYQANKEKELAQAKIYRDTHKNEILERSKFRRIKRRDYFSQRNLAKYGITKNDYEHMFVEQEGRCAICETSVLWLPKSLAIDHNHKTGKVRALLCVNCNSALGLMGDSLIKLRKAVTYAEKWQMIDGD